MRAEWREAIKAHKAHAVAEWPREACGLVLVDGTYHACRNVADDPETEFEIDPGELLAVAGGRPAAVLHSHPTGDHPDGGRLMDRQEHPSERDRIGQRDMAVPWGVTVSMESSTTDPVWFGDLEEKAS